MERKIGDQAEANYEAETHVPKIEARSWGTLRFRIPFEWGIPSMTERCEIQSVVRTGNVYYRRPRISCSNGGRRVASRIDAWAVKRRTVTI